MAQYGEPGYPMDFVTWLIKIAFNPIGVRGQLDLSEVAKSSRGPVWFGQEFWGSGPKSSDHNREQPILRVWENIIAHYLQVSLSHTNTWIYIQAISASEPARTCVLPSLFLVGWGGVQLWLVLVGGRLA